LGDSGLDNNSEEKTLLEGCQKLQQSYRCLLLSTVSEQGVPLASFAPYVQYQDDFYILVSELAEHTGNMLSVPIASVMFIESEQSAKNIFARQRAVIQVSIRPVTQPRSLVDELLALMQEQHGNTVTVLQGLADFKILQLKPVKGRYVVGFGKAYDWDVKGRKMTHISASSSR